MAHDVFISYSTKNKVIADAVCAKLEENGIRVWIAPRDVPAGDNFANSIIAAIDACKVFVLIWSEHTSEHILTEINHAFDQNIVIIPFRIQNIQPTRELQYYLGRSHWLDAIDPPLEDHIMALVNVVRAHLNIKKEQNNSILTNVKTNETPKIEKPVYADNQTKLKRTGKLGKYPLIIGGALIIIALVFLLLQILNGSNLANNTRPDSKVPIASQTMTAEQNVIPADVSSSPQVPSDLAGDWKTDDLHAADNSWIIPYSVYFRFIDDQQIVYHGDGEYANNQPADASDIVYVSIKDSTFVKKMVENPGHPEAVGKFQKWTWQFDIETVLFTIYGEMDSLDQALSDNNVFGMATSVYVK